ncbi:hypothetical protein THER5_1977 [Bifidobacterium thermacidophilum subsp. thermacidophilum]|uniref:Uncharacterized protein n=1 Tax=Bifidobacterium thermacidophilum subsp. thermacidophilum TaxID=79262 RepID=A0A087E2D4_9BIFI|nr:hypothetical protein THER5_1977 [Bifidobacterium thermacidophilum subsp. thermacidophilum]
MRRACRITDLGAHLAQYCIDARPSRNRRPAAATGTTRCNAIPRSPSTPRSRNPGVAHASCATSHRCGRIPLSLISRRHGNPKIRRLLTIPVSSPPQNHERGRASHTT